LRPEFTLRKKRSVHLTIAAMALAVACGAVALTTTSALAGPSTDTQAAALGTSLPLRVTPREPQYNHPVTVTGHGFIQTGRTVALQTASAGGSAWRTLTTGQVGPGGDYKLRSSLSRSGLIRIVPASSGEGAATVSASAASASGGARLIQVGAEFRVNQRSREIAGGSALRVPGRLLPAVGGRTVRLQARAGHGWQTLASARTGSGGGFVVRSHPASGLQRSLRIVFAGDAANAPSVRSLGRLTVYGGQSVASWYEDAGATACGFHSGYGVANRSLPCGTKVRFRYGGRSVTAVVDDRGPFVGGRDWDLNQNTAAALGFDGVGTVWTSS
jgi:hypothetical protein